MSDTKHTKAQFGMTVGADFEASTMTLLMDPGYVVAVGPVAVLPLATYEDLLEALRQAEWGLRNLLLDDAPGATECRHKLVGAAQAALAKALGS